LIAFKLVIIIIIIIIHFLSTPTFNN
jgi:hypothetical protein